MSNVSIIGLGTMARALATSAVAAGNRVQVIGRDESRAAALAAELGNLATSGTTDSPLTGDLVILAVPYESAVPIVKQYGDALAGKVIVDVTNPFDRATLTTLISPRESSAAEEIAAATAGAKVVKAFNTLFSGVLTAGRIDGHPVDVFLAGDDADAKKAVAELVDSMGLRPLDTGDLSFAHWLEGAGLLILGQAKAHSNFALTIKILG